MHLYPIQIALPRRYQPSPDGLRLVLLQDTFDFQVRPISRREYKDWTLRYPLYADLEDRILQEAVLAHPPEFAGRPWDWEEVPAGLVDRVVREILALSCFTHAPHPLVIERVGAYLQSDEARYDLILLTAMPYTLGQLWEMDPEEWHCAVAHAHEKLMMMGIDSESILDPASYAKKMDRMRAAQGAQDDGQYIGRGVKYSQKQTGFEFRT